MSTRPLPLMRRRRGSHRPRWIRRFETELRARLAGLAELPLPDGAEERLLERARREGILLPSPLH